MKTQKYLLTLLTWLPSIGITSFFIPNAMNKILHPHQTEKIITNPTLMLGVGLLLLVATILFLYKKAAIIGAAFLAFYMSTIVCIHLYKGKPAEIAMLLVVAIVFAVYIRIPEVFTPKNNSSIEIK